jgi:hypothetical protein
MLTPGAVLTEVQNAMRFVRALPCSKMASERVQIDYSPSRICRILALYRQSETGDFG